MRIKSTVGLAHGLAIVEVVPGEGDRHNIMIYSPRQDDRGPTRNAYAVAVRRRADVDEPTKAAFEVIFAIDDHEFSFYGFADEFQGDIVNVVDAIMEEVRGRRYTSQQFTMLQRMVDKLRSQIRELPIFSGLLIWTADAVMILDGFSQALGGIIEAVTVHESASRVPQPQNQLEEMWSRARASMPSRR